MRKIYEFLSFFLIKPKGNIYLNVAQALTLKA
jgi:hypothetical protein